LDPDSVTLWIRIRIGNPDPDPGARKLRNFSRKMHFLVFKKKVPLKRYKIALTTFWRKKIDEKHRYFWIDLTQILISKKFEKKIVFESSILAWIRIRIEQKCWIRIRIESIRIHNPGYRYRISLFWPDIRLFSLSGRISGKLNSVSGRY
jgi:hypothetical protein